MDSANVAFNIFTLNFTEVHDNDWKRVIPENLGIEYLFFEIHLYKGRVRPTTAARIRALCLAVHEFIKGNFAKCTHIRSPIHNS